MIDAAAALSRLAMTCDAWAALPTSAQLAAAARLPDVASGAYDANAAATAITFFCYDAARLPPATPPLGLTTPAGTLHTNPVPPLAPAPPVTAPELWSRLGATCATWGPLTGEGRKAALYRIGITTDDGQSAALAVLSAACTAPSLNDGQTWLDRMHLTCDGWRALAPGARVAMLQARGVTALDDLVRVMGAIDPLCTAPSGTAATSTDDTARAVIARNVLTCASWTTLAPAAQATLATAAGATDAPAVVARVGVLLGCASAGPAAPLSGLAKAGIAVGVAAALVEAWRLLRGRQTA